MDLLLQQKLEKMISGQASFSSHNLGFNLLVSRLKKNYAANSTVNEMKSCIQEVDIFLKKYNGIMVGELEAIKKL